MDTMHEIIPFAKEMLAQKPSRRMLKVYLVGSVIAFLGTVLGLVETVCQPFSSGEPLDAELALLIAREQKTLEVEEERRREEERRLEEVAVVSATEQITIPKKLQQATGVQRCVGAVNRLHAG
ncbi:G0/G1 switch protein 2-like [Salvelinus alpinus]|uniref:G0/G1 switch protein 2 n=1 Tax=Salvelinus sp. IW2-2015 TaxID=2691554 RepID=UPI000CDFCEC1|nr:G0/G1 switch protein 2 [Salvelinus alpinus]